MPSPEFTHFNSRRITEVIEFADIFDNINSCRRGPNTNYGLLNGALVLLASSWEIYCEEVCKRAIKLILEKDDLNFSQLPDRMKSDIIRFAGSAYKGNCDPLQEKIAQLPDGGWKNLLIDKLEEYTDDFNTPKFYRAHGKNLEDMFRHVLGIKISASIDNLLEENGFCRELDRIISVRGEIAHTGGVSPENSLTSSLLREYATTFQEAAAAIEIVLHREFREKLHFAPWQITEPVRRCIRENVRDRL